MIGFDIADCGLQIFQLQSLITKPTPRPFRRHYTIAQKLRDMQKEDQNSTSSATAFHEPGNSTHGFKASKDCLPLVHERFESLGCRGRFMVPMRVRWLEVEAPHEPPACSRRGNEADSIDYPTTSASLTRWLRGSRVQCAKVAFGKFSPRSSPHSFVAGRGRGARSGNLVGNARSSDIVAQRVVGQSQARKAEMFIVSSLKTRLSSVGAQCSEHISPLRGLGVVDGRRL